VALGALQNQPRFLQSYGQTYVQLLDFRNAKGFTYGNSSGKYCGAKNLIWVRSGNGYAT